MWPDILSLRGHKQILFGDSRYREDQGYEVDAPLV
jgi:hypothetical protein